MYLWTRSVRMLQPDPDALSAAVDMGAYASRKSDLDYSVWTQTLGSAPGTITWSTMAESMADFAKAAQTLQSKNGYWERVQSATEYFSLAEDRMSEIVHMAGEMQPDNPVVGIISAQAVDIGAAHLWAIEVAEIAEDVGGAPIAVCSSRIGPVGQIAWIASYPDVAAGEAAAKANNADERYLAKMSEATGLFVPGSGEQMISTRIS